MEINAQNIFTLKPHRYAEMFPDMGAEDFSNLVASVKKLGRLRHSVVIYEDQILDGRHRLKACKIAKVEPKWVILKGTDREAIELVWDMNYPRRNLNPSQKAFAVAQYSKFADEGHQPESQRGHVTTLGEAAKKAGVGKSTMQRAKKVVQHGTKEQVEAIKKGDATVTGTAHTIASRNESDTGMGEMGRDSVGFHVPEAAQAYWSRKEEAQQILNQLRAAKAKIKSLSPEDPMWCEVNLNGVLGDLSDACNRFAAAIPAYVCVYCQGIRPEKCTTCKSRGVVSAYMWKLIPEELRKMRESQVK